MAILSFAKIANFWRRLLTDIKKTHPEAVPQTPPSLAQEWRDFTRLNLLSCAIVKLNNLVNSESTFGVESAEESERMTSLVLLCDNLERHRYNVTASMLADGDFFVFPATDKSGGIYHSYVPKSQVMIVDFQNEHITKGYAIIDIYISNRNEYSFLLRKHELDQAGTLTISYQTVSEQNKPVIIEKWEELKDVSFKFLNANHIGFGWYRSPVDSRGTSPVYGVPLNFGCSSIEEKIFDDFKMLEDEFQNAKSKLIVPETFVKVSPEKRNELSENIYTYSQRSGQASPAIDIYSPQIRESEYAKKIDFDLSLYEKQIGVNKGILTENEMTATATATAVRRSNADTIALMNRIRESIDKGNKDTLQADCVFLNVPFDVWEYRSDWYDPFEDADGQWKRLIEGMNSGAVEKRDLVEWLFPSLSDDAIAEKLQRIKEEQAIDTDDAIENILMGRNR